MTPLYVWAAVGIAGVAYAIREEFRYRRETKRRVAAHTREAIDANRAKWPPHGRIVYVPPGHASMLGDGLRAAYWVGTMTGDDGLWHVYARGIGELDRGYQHRKSALRACRQMRAAAELAEVSGRLA